MLQQIVEVDPLKCPTCHGVMRHVACITPWSMIDQILAHHRSRATTAHAAAAGGDQAATGPPALPGSAIAPYVHRLLARPG